MSINTQALVLSEERRAVILERLQRDGKVISAQLSQDLGVSEDTVRRDLRELSEAGRLKRVHGGALPLAPTQSHNVRLGQSNEAKVEIAKRGARLIQPESVVIIDGGTTTLELCRHLPTDLRATFITNSPPAAVALAEYPYLEVITLGGRLLKTWQVNVGAATVEALKMVRADMVFLGVDGFHLDEGMSVLELEEVYVKQAMLKASAEVVGLVTSDKFGTVASYVFAPVNQLTHLVTDKSATSKQLGPYKKLGITLVPD
jgi:DeoR/GlpR family transcriptional regulator of sugar metabolism